MGLKDPIFDHLNKTSQIKFVLHEKLLYTTGKSLLIENESLYQSAIKLYNTRNKIVHNWKVENEKNILIIDSTGSKEAYNTVIKLACWLGFSHYDLIQDVAFVEN